MTLGLEHTLGCDAWQTLLVGCGAAFLALVATPIARRLALHHGAMDSPGARRVHARVTPRMGGVAVLFAILTTILIWLRLESSADFDRVHTIATALPILMLGAMVCLFGAIDDLTPISPKMKLAGLATAGLLLAVSGIRIEHVHLPWFGPFELGAWAIPATVFWVLACTNAVNLIDGVDGSGPGVVTIAGLTLALLAFGLSHPVAAVLFAATGGAAAGFLFHNKQPASIFLGDSGSLLLGFMLAATSAVGCARAETALMLTGALLALAVPFLDATQSFCRRFFRALRERPYAFLAAVRATARADLGHIHHRLLHRGRTHRQVARRICVVTLLLSLTGLLFLPTGEIRVEAIVMTLVIGTLVLARLGLTAANEISAPTVDESGPQSRSRAARPSVRQPELTRSRPDSPAELRAAPRAARGDDLARCFRLRARAPRSRLALLPAPAAHGPPRDGPTRARRGPPRRPAAGRSAAARPELPRRAQSRGLVLGAASGRRAAGTGTRRTRSLRDVRARAGPLAPPRPPDDGLRGLGRRAVAVAAAGVVRPAQPGRAERALVRRMGRRSRRRALGVRRVPAAPRAPAPPRSGAGRPTGTQRPGAPRRRPGDQQPAGTAESRRRQTLRVGRERRLRGRRERPGAGPERSAGRPGPARRSPRPGAGGSGGGPLHRCVRPARRARPGHAAGRIDGLGLDLADQRRRTPVEDPGDRAELRLYGP